MRHTSNKRARQDRPFKKLRAEFLEEFPSCWSCGSPSVLVHEMAYGMSIRERAFKEPCCWFPACTLCNEGQLGDRSVYPDERQLALKFIHDVGRLDLPTFCDVRGFAPTAITLVDIHPWILKELQR